MELRLLRYFVVVAEELHLARAAERLGIEQSPVSRAMRDLERSLGVPLFDRSSRRTQLTWAGRVLFNECQRVLATVDQALQVTRSAAQGYQSYLRIGVCDSLAQPRIATLLARSREEEPELGIRVVDMPFRQQLTALHNDLLDIGFAQSDAVGEGLMAEPVWAEPLVVILPARHPLLAHTQVNLGEALKYPLVLWHPEADSGCHNQTKTVLEGAAVPLRGVDYAINLGVMLTLVGSGYGIGYAVASQMQTVNRPDIATRPLAGDPPLLSTYLLRRQSEPSEPLKRLIARVKVLNALPSGEAGA